VSFFLSSLSILLSDSDHFVEWSRDWKKRRLVSSKEAVMFSNPEGNAILDEIPLHEILKVETILGSCDPETEAQVTSVIDVEQVELARWFLNSIQIATMPNGFNSGRIYYVRVETSSMCTNLERSINRLAKDAKARSSRFDFCPTIPFVNLLTQV
jgi:hypothetical protein